MREIGSVYAGDGPKLMGGRYRGHGLRGTDHGGRDRPSIRYRVPPQGLHRSVDDDALCNLDSPGPGMWAKLADPIEGKN